MEQIRFRPIGPSSITKLAALLYFRLQSSLKFVDRIDQLYESTITCRGIEVKTLKVYQNNMKGSRKKT